MVLESSKWNWMCPVFPAALVEESVFSPSYILASLVTDWLIHAFLRQWGLTDCAVVLRFTLGWLLHFVMALSGPRGGWRVRLCISRFALQMTRTVTEPVERGCGSRGLSHQFCLGNVHRNKRHDDSAEAPTGSKKVKRNKAAAGLGWASWKESLLKPPPKPFSHTSYLTSGICSRMWT